MIFIQNNQERLRGHVRCRLQSTLSLSEACYTPGPLMTPRRALLCPATPTICDESQTCGTLSFYEKHHQGRCSGGLENLQEGRKKPGICLQLAARLGQLGSGGSSLQFWSTLAPLTPPTSSPYHTPRLLPLHLLLRNTI
ncbi:hypothetical protein Q8A67_025278 [Cirrhinus molitorella]|uniref:Uncharacterized protein n=1 Tax=Cirrhinus molitorella TaxID=172907 RepID=A0AA88T768_9TELE|nr:hypothetical protein Q8A67_025278 [Cirrhinus molitorella]